MKPNAGIPELDDGQLVCQLLPPDWQEQARLLGALRRARGFPPAAVLLRTLLVHVAGACSLKETVTRVPQAGGCNVSAVALFQRLRASEHWLRWMADPLWQRPPPPSLPHGYRVRASDATSVSRPGCRGTDWRVHCSINRDDLPCAFIQVTAAHGGETCRRIPVAAGAVLWGDRCYRTPPGIAHVAQAGGHVLVRVNHKTLPLLDLEGKPFGRAAAVRALTVGAVREWPTVVRHEQRDYPGRLVAVKRDRGSACLEGHAVRKRATKKNRTVSRTARLLAGYFFVWTDVPTATLDATAGLAW